MQVTKKPRLHQDWIDPHAAGIIKALQRQNFTTYLVGGCVRDLLLGMAPKDFDIVTSARPDQVKRIIHKAYVIGKRFRLVLVKRDDQQFEVATFRRDVREDENAEELPSGDNIFGTPEEDAQRRDFTINSLFYDPVGDQLIDYANGLQDLEARLVRMIGDPNKRLLEDPIRILRALRLAHMVDFTLEEDLRRGMQVHASCLAASALPRRREEILKLLRLKDPGLAFIEAYDLGILHILALVPTPFASRAAAKNFFEGEFLSRLGEDPKARALSQFFYSNMEEKSPGQVDWRFHKAGILMSLQSGRQQDRWAEYQSLQIPILVVRGEESSDLGHAEFDRMLQLNSYAEGIEIPGAGHWVHADQPERFIQALQNFFTKILTQVL